MLNSAAFTPRILTRSWSWYTDVNMGINRRVQRLQRHNLPHIERLRNFSELVIQSPPRSLGLRPKQSRADQTAYFSLYILAVAEVTVTCMINNTCRPLLMNYCPSRVIRQQNMTDCIVCMKALIVWKTVVQLYHGGWCVFVFFFFLLFKVIFDSMELGSMFFSKSSFIHWSILAKHSTPTAIFPYQLHHRGLDSAKQRCLKNLACLFIHRTGDLN